MRKYPMKPRRPQKQPFRQYPRTRGRRSFLERLSGPRLVMLGLAIGVGLGIGAAVLGKHGLAKLVSYAGLTPLSACNIKGNISIRTGERIYHVPGQRYYSATVINPLYGERYFCSEEEAQEAGWRRARI